jgi:hypothetical protein
MKFILCLGEGEAAAQTAVGPRGAATTAERRGEEGRLRELDCHRGWRSEQCRVLLQQEEVIL